MILVKTADWISAVTLELQEFSLPNPQYCEEALNARAIRLFVNG